MSKKQSSKTSKPASKKASKSAQATQQAAHAEPVAAVTTAAPAAESPAAVVTAPAAAKPAKAPKVAKVPREERFGVKRPKADGACGRVWAHLDAKGDMSVADIKAWAITEGQNPGNAAIGDLSMAQVQRHKAGDGCQGAEGNDGSAADGLKRHRALMKAPA
ncbi:MAG: hypothetical protein V9E93_16540 [Steroidobacteraceae bacterium]